jgi:hypothetical protein
MMQEQYVRVFKYYLHVVGVHDALQHVTWKILDAAHSRVIFFHMEDIVFSPQRDKQWEGL